MDEITLTALHEFRDEKGTVRRIIRSDRPQVREVYMSSVNQNTVKGWKRHNRMTLNIAVIKGSIRFVVRKGQSSVCHVLGEKNYKRLTIPPGFWVAFEGLDDENILINCADMIHDPTEADSLEFKNYEQDLTDR